MTGPTIAVGARAGVKGGFFLGGIYGLFVMYLNVAGGEGGNAFLGIASLFIGAAYGAGAGLALGAVGGWLLSRVEADAVQSVRLRMVGGLVLIALAGPFAGSLVGIGEVGTEELVLFTLPTLIAAAYAYYAAPRVKAAAELSAPVLPRTEASE